MTDTTLTTPKPNYSPDRSAVMPPLRRYILIMVMVMAGIYGSLLAISYIAFVDDPDNAIDSARANNTVYGTEPRYVLYKLDELLFSGPQVILVGASNVREGFRPDQLQPLLSRHVNNLAIGSSNIRQVSEVVDLAYSHIPQTLWPELTFVYGAWYGQFVSDARIWSNNQTSIDNEGVRFGLYTLEGGQLKSHIPKALMPTLKGLIRPLMLVQTFYTTTIYNTKLKGQSIFLRLTGKKLKPSIRPDNEFHLTDEQKQGAILQWFNYMGPVEKWDERGFEELLVLAKSIHDHGSHLVILDLPLPSWHRDAVPYQAIYLQRMTALARKLELIPGVSLHSIANDFTDDDFYDSAHPRPRITSRWAELAANFILATEHKDSAARHR